MLPGSLRLPMLSALARSLSCSPSLLPVMTGRTAASPRARALPAPQQSPDWRGRRRPTRHLKRRQKTTAARALRVLKAPS
jgi:hypothetical protein